MNCPQAIAVLFQVFPYDYKCAELPNYGFNLSLMALDFFAYLGEDFKNFWTFV
jgi:hypothetical protein